MIGSDTQRRLQVEPSPGWADFVHGRFTGRSFRHPSHLGKNPVAVTEYSVPAGGGSHFQLGEEAGFGAEGAAGGAFEFFHEVLEAG